MDTGIQLINTTILVYYSHFCWKGQSLGPIKHLILYESLFSNVCYICKALNGKAVDSHPFFSYMVANKHAIPDQTPSCVRTFDHPQRRVTTCTALMLQQMDTF